MKIRRFQNRSLFAYAMNVSAYIAPVALSIGCFLRSSPPATTPTPAGQQVAQPAARAAASTTTPPPSIAPLPSPTQPRRLEVLFLGNEDIAPHKSSVLASILAARWASEGINIVYTVDLNDLNPATLSQYDVLLLYGDHPVLSKERETALLDFVASGKGFIGLHSAVDCFRNSDQFIALIGGQLKEHGSEEFTARIIAPEHPIFEGVHAFSSWDETYVPQRLNPDNTVLMERVDAKGREPWAWTRTHGKGRVFYLASGHSEMTWNLPDYQRLVRNAMLWTAGPEAVRRLMDYAIKPAVLFKASTPLPMTGGDSLTSLAQEPMSIEESQKHFQTRPGFEMQLFASEPDISNVLAMAWDERGRLWVVESDDYPANKQPLWKGHDRIKILEDTNHDGRADKVTIFAEGLSIPNSLAFANGGVIISAPPEFLFLKDTTGDDKADIREVLYSGWHVSDTHGGPSGLRYGFDNLFWGIGGGFNGLVNGQPTRVGSAFHFNTDGTYIENAGGGGGANLWGLGFTEAFELFTSGANNGHSAFTVIPPQYSAGFRGRGQGGSVIIDGHYAVHPNVQHIRQVDVIGGYTAATGQSFYNARAWPREYWGATAMVNEPTAHVVHWARIDSSGTIYRESDNWNLVASDDQYFTPIMSDIGPDGQVWILDWHHLIIQHNNYSRETKTTAQGNAWESPLRNTGRFARIYRLVWKGSAPYTPLSLSKDRPLELVAALKHDNMFWRMKAQQLLVERRQRDVLEAIYPIVEDRSVDVIGLNGPAVNALWTLHGLGALDGHDARALQVAVAALRHPSWAVRQNALRVLPRTEMVLDSIVRADLLHDLDPRVRLAALLALTDYPSSKRIGGALYELGKEPATLQDEWISWAAALAANRHQAGFLMAYTEDVGLAEVLRSSALAARGELELFKNYAAPELNDSTAPWRTVSLPMPGQADARSMGGHRSSGEHGETVWLRKTFEFPRTLDMRTVTLAGMLMLGATPSSRSIVYVNGKRVNGTGSPRGPASANEWYVPPGMLKSGRNVIAVYLSSSTEIGVPMAVRADSTPLRIEGTSFSVNLNGDWHIQREATPGGNRVIMPTAPFALQILGMINPLGGLLDPLPPFPIPLSPVTADTRQPAPQTRRKTAAADTLRIRLYATSPMVYSQTLLSAKPGQLISLTFTNATADSPHNWALFDKMELPEVGKIMTAMLTDPDMKTRGYLPRSGALLQATQLLDPGGSAFLTFTAPTAPGDYPYVCTFPGHWQMMHGVLRVSP